MFFFISTRVLVVDSLFACLPRNYLQTDQNFPFLAFMHLEHLIKESYHFIFTKTHIYIHKMFTSNGRRSRNGDQDSPRSVGESLFVSTGANSCEYFSISIFA